MTVEVKLNLISIETTDTIPIRNRGRYGMAAKLLTSSTRQLKLLRALYKKKRPYVQNKTKKSQEANKNQSFSETI